MSTYVCTACGTVYPPEPTLWRCPCGGPFDLAAAPPGPLTVDHEERSLWRYRSALAFAPSAATWRSVTLGEGLTPLIAEGRHLGGPDVRLKLDFLMPTLSYKDRGAAVLVTRAAEMGVRTLVADSSGNAGSAVAAYAARARIEAEVFVPAATSARKVAQLQAFGATVRQIAGSRTDAAAAAIQRVERSGAFYASHVYNPWFLEGTKTFAYEIWEQLGRRGPGTVVVPAGNGTLLLGAAIGFRELEAAGEVTSVPRLVAVQAQRCAPVATVWAGRAPDPGQWSATVAEGIAIPEPPRLAQMVKAVDDTGGVVLTVSEDQIVAAQAQLAGRGIDVEPTAAAAWGAWGSWPEAEAAAGPVVVALTGAGLKSR